MIHLFLNGLAASAGGGLTYLRNVVPQFSLRTDVKATVAVSPSLKRELGELPNVSYIGVDFQGVSARRFWLEQTVLPQLIRRSGAEVLISAGNFALWQSPVPQILLSRNALYTSSEFFRDLLRRKEYLSWLGTHVKAELAKKSIQRAECTVVPSQAFGEELHKWTGRTAQVIHHGFDRPAFFQANSPLPPATRSKIQAVGDAFKLLLVSHYTYYRNFETLIRAMPLIKKKLNPRRVRLLLTCELSSGKNPGNYRIESAASLIRDLGMSEEIVELGTIPYGSLHHVYHASNVYVTPAYAETFAHPLVEAMACGLPIAASDIPVHREVCQSAALYFRCFSPQQLAMQIGEIANSPELATQMANHGRMRHQDFSWNRHVDQLLALIAGMRNTPARLCGS